MSLVDGNGKPIPPDSWGGDLDPRPTMRCSTCGCAIPFGKFCPTHLAEARAKNEEVLAKQIAESGPRRTNSSMPPEREVDMTVLMAKAQERAQAIVTPGAAIPPEPDHLTRDDTRTVGPNASMLNHAGLNVVPPPAAAAPSIVLTQGAVHQVTAARGADFLVNQGLIWITELRGLAEEGKLGRDLSAEVLQHVTALSVALVAALK